MDSDPRSEILEPVTLGFLQTLEAAGGTPIYKLPPAEGRQIFSGLQAGTPVALPPVDIEDRTIAAGPTGTIRLRLMRPPGSPSQLPAIVYYHGAGWVFGGTDTHDRLVRELCVGAQAALVFVDYDRAPEARYPIQLDQDYAALEWVAREGTAIGIDAARLAIAGDSVGGNMTAVIAQRAKARGGPALALQLMFYPVTDASLATGSYQAFGAGGYFLTTPAMEFFWDAYLPDKGRRNTADLSPLNAPLDALHGLPPALVITAENDVLRDEGEAYGRRLAAAGVDTVSVRFNGTIHDFVMLNALAATPAARGAIALACTKLRQALHG
jgi:acetyl esterase